MLVGEFAGASPTILARLSFPELPRDTVVDIDFLLDTGANLSVIHPRNVAAFLGVGALGTVPTPARIEALARAVDATFGHLEQEHARGIGGTAAYYAVSARVQFTDSEGWPVTYRHDVVVARPSATNWTYPSFLGMDFLTYFDVRLNHGRNVVALEFETTA